MSNDVLKPGRAAGKKKGFAAALSSAVNVTTADRTRDGWRLPAKIHPR